jgi:hypothetical protein
MKLEGENPSTRGGNLSQCHFVHHKSHMDWPGSKPGLRGDRPATNRLSHSTGKLASSVSQPVRWTSWNKWHWIRKIMTEKSNMSLSKYTSNNRHWFDTNSAWTCEHDSKRDTTASRVTFSSRKDVRLSRTLRHTRVCAHSIFAIPSKNISQSLKMHWQKKELQHEWIVWFSANAL